MLWSKNHIDILCEAYFANKSYWSIVTHTNFSMVLKFSIK